MYKAFYNSKRNPFEITPDPSFLFPTRRHNEALAALYYGVRRHKGFVVLTGEVGTGKTLLLRCLLQSLPKQSEDVKYAYVFNGRLSPVEFLQYIAGDLGLPTAGKNKSELLLQLADYVVARGREKTDHRAGRRRGASFVDRHSGRNPAAHELWKLPTRSCCRFFWWASPNWMRSWIPRVAAAEAEHCPALPSGVARFKRNQGAISSAGWSWREVRMQPLFFRKRRSCVIHRLLPGHSTLINTICENALIAGYAQAGQRHSGHHRRHRGRLSPGVQTTPAETRRATDEVELREIARKVL
jgi:energy-coupling factor transporter ATP-binding protein EcfA2